MSQIVEAWWIKLVCITKGLSDCLLSSIKGRDVTASSALPSPPWISLLMAARMVKQSKFKYLCC